MRRGLMRKPKGFLLVLRFGHVQHAPTHIDCLLSICIDLIKLNSYNLFSMAAICSVNIRSA
jgi:hypothetical protein